MAVTFPAGIVRSIAAQDLGLPGSGIAKAEIGEPQRAVRRHLDHGRRRPEVVLVAVLVDFLHPLEAQPGVLRGVDEVDQPADGRVELADDVLRGEHHAERHLPLDDGARGEKGDEDVAQIRGEEDADALHLPQGEALALETVGAHGELLPVPAFVALDALDLDLRHRVDDLEERVALLRFEREALVVEDPGAASEKAPASRRRAR